MDFSQRQAAPGRHLIGFTLVIAFHALLVYALVTGLAKKVVLSVIAPIETRVIEEVRKPPPPPEPAAPPPPKIDTLPPPFIPPPEVQLASTPPPAATITATTPEPPAAVVEIAPAVPPAAPAPVVAAPPAPPPARPAAPVSAAAACSKMAAPQPPEVSTEVKGSVFVLATLKAGRVTQVEVERSTLRGLSDRRVMRSFVAAIESAMRDGYVCSGDGIQIRQEFVFDIQ
jgi:protein TonB